MKQSYRFEAGSLARPHKARVAPHAKVKSFKAKKRPKN